MTDINQLLHDHQLAMMNSQQSFCREERNVYSNLTEHHAGRITRWRRALGLSNTGWPRDQRAYCVSAA